MEQRQPQRGENGRRPQVGLDALHDRCQGEELAWRVHVEQLVDQIGRAVDDREPVTSPCSRGAPVGDLGRPLDVLGIELPRGVRPARRAYPGRPCSGSAGGSVEPVRRPHWTR